MKKTLIKADKITKSYVLPAETIHAVELVDVTIQEGDFMSIMGPSGSGKTTLLDVLGCLSAVSEGTLTVFEKNVSDLKERELVNIRRDGISFVFQDFLLLPTLSAVENVMLPMCFGSRKPDKDQAVAMLERVGLGHRIRHLPRQLSGGERQRVSIARALAVKPRLLFADEPTGNLDSHHAHEVFDVFHQLNADDSLTIVVATHDKELGNQAPRVLNMRDGKIA
ncbi:MAG: ABC transporter ATP-binding protein [Kiritimatiellae bacterium]|nr:ABC transporter ATP-binding protein [Kiritimatiellia bacterium]